jgi:hypothetical protein
LGIFDYSKLVPNLFKEKTHFSALKPSLSPWLNKKKATSNTKICIVKGFDVQQTAFAVRKYKSHCHSVSEILEAIRLQEEHSTVLVNF